jgi:hypothetical protein
MTLMVGRLLLTLLMLGGPPDPDAVTPLPSAETLFRDGLKAYDAHDYPRALTFFEAAYRLSPLPEILFDIAMTHRSAGDCARAAKGFDAFIAVASTSDPLLPRAQARRRELTSCAAADTAAPALVASPAAPPSPAPPPVPVAVRPTKTSPPTTITLASGPPPPRSRLNTACLASIGGGGVLAAAGAVFGVRAWSAAQEAESAPTWNEGAQRADERARTFEQTSTILLMSAGVASLVALGTCSYGSWWGRNKGSGHP